jgi:hypothetical protein
MSLERFTARTQANVAYLIIGALVMVVLALILLAAFGRTFADPVVQLLTTLAVGLLGLAGQPTSYLFQRQRPKNGDGATDESKTDQPRPGAGSGTGNRTDDAGTDHSIT